MQETKTPNLIEHADPHTYAHPGEAVVTNLSLNLQVDFDRKTLNGYATLTIVPTVDAKEIILDTRDLSIEKTLADDKEVPFTLGDADRILGRALHIPVTGKTKTVTVFYATSPGAAALQWLAPTQTAGGRHPFLFTQSQAILARTWIPVQDSPGIRFTYDATVKVPYNLLAVMSAENPQSRNASGIYQFRMPQPVPAYLMAMAVGDISFKPLDERSGVYAEPVTLDRAVNEFAELPRMIEAAEKLYGPYAWGRYDVIVLPPSFPFGGMENPRLTFATPTILAGDRSLTSLIAHELAHSWSGNLVTNATWNDFWMNEGFTVYFENRIMESIYGKDFSDMQALLGLEDLKETIAELGETSADTRLKLNLEGRDPDDGVSDIAYEKGHFLLLLIEQTIGRDKFDAFLREYFKRHAFKTITTEEFLVEYRERLIGGDSSLAEKIKIEDWIYQPGLPANCPQIHSAKFEAVKKEVEAWLAGKPAAALNTKDYTTNEWLRFIRYLPDTLSHDKMKELDEAFHFSGSGNSEILFAWLLHVISNKYEKTYPVLKDFLNQVGRRKFVKPLFVELVKTEEGKKMAREIYQTARPNYHSVTRETIDEIINKK
jgi:leukotriene A-4 hydrolase/aminopeptidase